MKSSSGDYFQALDHVRALAAFTVFAWHYSHFRDGHLADPLAFPLSFLTEGHTGVAIFMTLSGYLFARLLDGRKLMFPAFLFNRFLRLAPLLGLVVFVVILRKAADGSLDAAYLRSLAGGVVLPTLPNGGWSLTVEAHFYLALPLLLYFARRWPGGGLLAVVLAALALRAVLYALAGEIQSLAYWTIIGRIDQFVLGMLAYRLRNQIAGHPLAVAAGGVAFLLFWHFFDSQGGFYRNGDYPSPSPLWVFISSIEGACYASAIAAYDASAWGNGPSRMARLLARIGTWSYSIYLLHFFVVFRVPVWIDRYLIDLSNPYLHLASLPVAFLLMLPVAYLSYRYVESPFLRYRRAYLA